MKKRSSIVWRFFDRLEDQDSKRCVGVLCKLCEHQYKFFGNTTNMRAHLTCKHPLQWELAQNGSLDDSALQFPDDAEEPTITVQPRRKYKDKNVRYSVSVNVNNDSNISGEDSLPQIEIQTVDVLENYESDLDHQEDTEAGIHLVRQMRESRATDEEWLEEETYQTVEPSRKQRKMPFKRIKREIESPPRRLSFKPKVVNYEPERIIYQTPKDEYSVFGEYVANKLRKVRVPKTRGNLQQLITTILWQAEYGMYDSADAVKRVLSYTVDDNSDRQSTNVVIEQEQNQSTEIEEDSLVTN